MLHNMTSLCIKISVFQHESHYLQIYQTKLSYLFQSVNTLYKWFANMYTPNSTYLFRPSSGSVSLSAYPPSAIPENSIKSAVPVSQTRASNHTTSSTVIDLGKNGLSLRNVLQNVNSISELQDIVSCVSNVTSFSSKSRPASGRPFISESRKTVPASSDTCLTQNSCNKNNSDKVSDSGKEIHDLTAVNWKHVPEPPAPTEHRVPTRARGSVNSTVQQTVDPGDISTASPDASVHEIPSESIVSKRVVLAGIVLFFVTFLTTKLLVLLISNRSSMYR